MDIKPEPSIDPIHGKLFNPLSLGTQEEIQFSSMAEKNAYLFASIILGIFTAGFLHGIYQLAFVINCSDPNTKAIKTAIQEGQIALKIQSPFEYNLSKLIQDARQLPDGSYELLIENVNTVDGKNDGRLKVRIKLESIYDTSGQLLSQIKDPIYRAQLKKNDNRPHYSFEFYDLDREKSQELKDLEGMSPSEIQDYDSNLYDVMLNSLREEFNKPTLKGRISPDGSIGELKSVNVHSPKLGGKQLMDQWDQLCTQLQPKQIYLEDDAKIEKANEGSYNLRLYRLLGEENKSSWYQDAYHYQHYEQSLETQAITSIPKESDPALTAAILFRERPISSVLGDLNKLNHLKAKEIENAIKQNVPHGQIDSMTMKDLIKSLGLKAMKGDPVHQTLHLLLTGNLECYAAYQGDDPELKDLKIKAIGILDAKFLRKSYS